MGLTTQKILGIDVTISSEDIILEEVRKCLQKSPNPKSEIRKNGNKPLLIFTPNPEIITYGLKDANFRKIVNTAQTNLPDGSGVVWALRKLYKIKVAKISGADFMGKLVNLAEKESLRIGLIGGRGDLAVRTLECLQKKHSKLSGWATGGPEIEITNYKLQITNKLQISNEQIKEITDKILKEKTDILFVAMGFPKQEYFIESVKREAKSVKLDKPLVMMAVGGSFDYISGRVLRAPLFIRNSGLEWLYRLIREPRRLPRQLKGAEFFLHIAFPSFFPIQ